MWIFLFWIGFTLINGWIAGQKGRSVAGVVILSLLFTPLLPFLYLLAASNLRHETQQAVYFTRLESALRGPQPEQTVPFSQHASAFGTPKGKWEGTAPSGLPESSVSADSTEALQPIQSSTRFLFSRLLVPCGKKAEKRRDGPGKRALLIVAIPLLILMTIWLVLSWNSFDRSPYLVAHETIVQKASLVVLPTVTPTPLPAGSVPRAGKLAADSKNRMTSESSLSSSYRATMAPKMNALQGEMVDIVRELSHVDSAKLYDPIWKNRMLAHAAILQLGSEKVQQYAAPTQDSILHEHIFSVVTDCSGSSAQLVAGVNQADVMLLLTYAEPAERCLNGLRDLQLQLN